MNELEMEHIYELALILIMIAAGITAVSKKLKQPYPIALVVVGALIGIFNITWLDPLKLFITEGPVFHFVIVSLFLPVLLGEASLKLPFSHLKENKWPILFLAFFGTLVSYLIVGFLAVYFLDFPVPAAFVFAALMSATDPVSVLSIFKTVGVNKKLSIVVEGESLFNDGLAVVLFKISAFSLLAYLDAGWIGLGSGIWEFVRVICLGAMIGGAFGYVASKLTSYFDDYPLEIIFSIILFYGAFITGELLHASGVIAVVVAGIILGNYGARIGMTPTTKLNINTFWDVAALLANSIVFLMIGLEITRISFSDKWPMILLALSFVLAARSIAVYSSLAFLKSFPYAWKHIINWGGLKGSLSIALALSLPRDFEFRGEILVLTFSVVLFSLVVQGISVKPLIRLLGLKPGNEVDADFELAIAHLQRYESAIKEINRRSANNIGAGHAAQELLSEYKTLKEAEEAKLAELFLSNPALLEKQKKRLRIHALYAEHEAISTLNRDEIISNQTSSKEHETITDQLINLEEKNH